MPKTTTTQITELFLKFVLWWTPARRLRTQDHFDRIGLFYLLILFAGCFNFIGGIYDFKAGFQLGSFLALSAPLFSIIFMFLIRTTIPTAILEHAFVIYILAQFSIELTFSHGLDSPYIHYAVFPAGFFFLMHPIKQGIIALFYTAIFVLLGVWGSSVIGDHPFVMTDFQQLYFDKIFYVSHIILILVYFISFNLITAEGRKFRVASGQVIANQRESFEYYENRVSRLEGQLTSAENELMGYKDNTQFLMKETTTSLRNRIAQQEFLLENQKQFEDRFYKQILDQSADIINHSEIYIQNQGIEDIHRFVNLIKHKSDSLSNLVIQASHYRSESVEQTSSSDFDIRQLLDSCIDNALIGHNQLFINHINQIDYRIPRFLFGQPEKLSRIITNLIHHSYCITPKGFIQLQVYFTKQQDEKISLQFRIRDSGLVLNKEQSKKIFKPFATLDLYPSFVNQLNGLELALSKKWVEELGGSLEFKYHPSLGNTLSFNLTFSDSALNAAFNDKTNLLSENTFFPDIQAAIINENKVSTGIIEKNLRKWDVIYRSTQNIKGVDELLHNQQYDLIFWDARGSDEIFNKLKDHNFHNPQTKIILLPIELHESDFTKELPASWVVLEKTPNEETLFECLCKLRLDI